MKRFFVFLLVFGALFLTEVRSEEVRVEGEAVSEPEAAHPTGSVTVIDTESAMSRVSDVGEALEQSAGVTIKRYGGLGSFSMVMIRGSSPNQVSVFLDGVPLSGAATGVVNLADLPLDALERIEVYRGVAPLGFGGAPIGGVVNLVTLRAKRGWRYGGAASYGSFDTYKSDLFASAAFEKWNALVFYSHLQSEGDFEYLDDNATDYNLEDDRKTKRKNNDFMSETFLVKGGYKIAYRWEIFAADDFFHKDAGLPGLGAFTVEAAGISTLRNSSYLGAHYRGSMTEMRTLAYYTYIEEEYSDPLGEVGLGTQKNRYFTNTWGMNALGRIFFGKAAVLALFAEGKSENYAERDLLNDADEPTSERVTLTGATQAEFYLYNARLILVPTIRVEHYESDFPGRSSATYGLESGASNASDTLASPHFGLRITPSKTFFISANVGKYYRVPSFIELFGDRGSIVGNPELDVESGIHADAGVGLSFKKRDRLDRLQITSTFFYLHMEDIIVMVQNSQRTARAENISRAEIYGNELCIEAVWGGFIKSRAAYTLQDARDRSGISYMDGNSLPGRPRNELHTKTALFRKKLGEVFYTFDYIDGNFLDRSGLMEVPARQLHGAGITYTPIKGLSLTFEVKNIGDEQVSDVLGYPLPGRSFFGTVKYVSSSRGEN